MALGFVDPWHFVVRGSGAGSYALAGLCYHRTFENIYYVSECLSTNISMQSHMVLSMEGIKFAWLRLMTPYLGLGSGYGLLHEDQVCGPASRRERPTLLEDGGRVSSLGFGFLHPILVLGCILSVLSPDIGQTSRSG